MWVVCLCLFREGALYAYAYTLYHMPVGGFLYWMEWEEEGTLKCVHGENAQKRGRKEANGTRLRNARPHRWTFMKKVGWPILKKKTIGIVCTTTVCVFSILQDYEKSVELFAYVFILRLHTRVFFRMLSQHVSAWYCFFNLSADGTRYR